MTKLKEEKKHFGHLLTNDKIGTFYRPKKDGIRAFDFFSFKKVVFLNKKTSVLLYVGLMRNSFLMSFHSFITERGQFIVISHEFYGNDCLEEIKKKKKKKE